MNLIKSVISLFNEKGIAGIHDLGNQTEVLANGASKFSANDERILHFLVFRIDENSYEICFLGSRCEFCIDDIEREFGRLQLHYNFRENYSEFKFGMPGAVYEIFFIKDNKFEVTPDGGYAEKDPQGRAVYHNKLCFEGFCLRLRG